MIEQLSPRWAHDGEQTETVILRDKIAELIRVSNLQQEQLDDLKEAVNKLEKLDWETYKKEMEERFKAINPN